MITTLIGMSITFIAGLVIGRGHGPAIVKAVRDCTPAMFKAVCAPFKRLRR